METDSAVAALRDLRTHAAQITGHVNDLHKRVDDLQQEGVARFHVIEKAHEALLAHMLSEHQRLDHESAAAVTEVTSLIALMTQREHKSLDACNAFTAAFEKERAGAEAIVKGFNGGITQLAAQMQTTVDALHKNAQDLQEELAAQQDQEHAALQSTITQVQNEIKTSATTHGDDMKGAEADFHSAQQSALSHTEQIATAGVHALAARASTLHDETAHDVANLQTQQEHHAADLTHHVNELKSLVEGMMHTVTGATNGLADGVGASTELVQLTNVGVEEIVKIVENIESTFKEIVDAFHS